MPPELIQLRTGQSFTVLAYGCDVITFITQEYTETERRKLLALLDRTADVGPPRNEQHFRSLGDGIYEFNANQARLTCFFDKNRLIICPHGFIKKRRKTRQRDIEKPKNCEPNTRRRAENENCDR